MKEQIKALVAERDYVSFAELARDIEGFRGTTGWEIRNTNIFLWAGMSNEAFDSVFELLESEDIHFVTAQWMSYVIDGATLAMPLAKTIRSYKEPHWLPVALRPGKGRKGSSLQVVRDASTRSEI